VNPLAPATKLGESYLLSHLNQPWHKNGICSGGTFAKFYTTSRANGVRLHGGSASLSIWAPNVARAGDFTTSSMLISIVPGFYISAGWITDNHMNGCWDLDCDGFVQVNNTLALGSPLQAVSAIGGSWDKNWWLRIGETHLGYWPASLTPADVADGASSIEWGGAVFDSIGRGNHTETDMGNGLFPNSDDASYMCQLRFFDESLNAHAPNSLSLSVLVTNPKCYNAKLDDVINEERGPCFYYGGSGLNSECP
ncbi:hypothetical protein RDABS01_020777, partial [Bienertia sinuspersici]